MATDASSPRAAVATNQQQIIAYLKKQGFTDHAVNGILGNLYVESGFNPSAFNAREGAVGIAQWEGGRREALQRYASSAGLNEHDLTAQLGFLVWEMRSSGFINQINNARSPDEAATLMDQQYERSAGTSRGARITAARNAASGQPLSSTTGNGAGLPSGGGSANYAADAIPTMTSAQRAAAIKSGAGDLYSLALAIPELHQLLNTAITTGQTASEFQNAIENTRWYRQHSDSVRQAIVLKQSDPSTYQKNLQQATAHITSVAQQLGVTPGTELKGIATRYMSEGWNDDQLLQFFQKAHVAWNFQGGAAGQAISQMRQIASDYGVPVTEQAYNQWAKNVATGADNIDSFRQRMIHNASSIYPGLATQLTGGQTTKQLADPYIAKMAETLELNPETIKWGSDPHIKRALQTPVTSPAGAGTKSAAGDAQPPGTTPLWQFEQQLRSDPRWNYTDNARSSTASLLTQLGKEWGMAA